MKNTKLIASIGGIILLCLFFGNLSDSAAQCGNHSDDHSKHASAQDTLSYYSCSMHPEVQTTFPANCPKCGMALVKISTDEKPKKNRMGMMGMGAMGIIMVAMMAFMIAGGAIYVMSR